MGNTLNFYDPTNPDTGYLSNFYRAPFELDGRAWLTAEHYYQAQKFKDEAYAERIRLAASPREAKTLGQTREVSLREDWETHRMTAMLSAVAAKFTQHEELHTRLLAPGDAIFAEASPTDAFWGDGPDGQGENRLGYLLTTLRNHLRLFLANEGAASMSSDQLAQKCFASVRQLHVTWFLPDALRMEAQVGVMPESINAYCRDANLPEHVLAQYRPGLIFREPTLCDASQHFGGFAARHRYLLLSGTARHLDEFFGGLSGSPGTGLSVWQPDTLWKVLSLHRQDEHTQITLIEIPPVAIHAFNAQALTTFEQSLAEKADEYFTRGLTQDPVLACATPEWLARLEHPLGINDGGEFLECWFNGIHRGGDASEQLQSAKTESSPEPTPSSPIQPLTRRSRRFVRLVGVAVLLIGLGIALELFSATPRPPQMVIMSVIMIGMGGLVAWKPDTFR